MGKVIHWELCKQFKFDHTKWYMYRTKFVLKNETHTLLFDFEIQIDHLISAWRPDLVLSTKYKKKKKKERKGTWWIVDFAVRLDHKIRLKETEKRDKLRYLENMKQEFNSDTNYKWCTWKIPKGLVKWREKLGIRGHVETILTVALLKSAGIPRRVSDICCKSNSSINHQLSLAWKTLKGVK